MADDDPSSFSMRDLQQSLDSNNQASTRDVEELGNLAQSLVSLAAQYEVLRSCGVFYHQWLRGHSITSKEEFDEKCRTPDALIVHLREVLVLRVGDRSFIQGEAVRVNGTWYVRADQLLGIAASVLAAATMSLVRSL